MSGRTGKRGKIPTLDARKDFHELFGVRGGDDTVSGPSSEDEETFGQMIDDTLSGFDQAEIIRQKYPEHPLESKKHQTGFFAKPQAELDLHGCHVREALVRVEAFLETAALQGMNTVLIIVGKGLHSQGSAVLPDAVEKKIVDLKRRGRVAAFTWEKKHKHVSGALLVSLK